VTLCPDQLIDEPPTVPIAPGYRDHCMVDAG